MPRFHFGAVAVLVLLIAPAAAQSQQDGKPVKSKRWSKSNGRFGAQLLLTDKPQQLFDDWEKPGRGVRISEADSAYPGVSIVAVVFFTGCGADAKGLAQTTVHFAAFGPDGKPYGEAFDGELWIDKPPPAKRQIQLGVSTMGLVLEPEDPLGVYTVRAKIVDKVSGKKLVLEREFRGVESNSK
jgi:hypothetical protein